MIGSIVVFWSVEGERQGGCAFVRFWGARGFWIVERRLWKRSCTISSAALALALALVPVLLGQPRGASGSLASCSLHFVLPVVVWTRLAHGIDLSCSSPLGHCARLQRVMRNVLSASTAAITRCSSGSSSPFSLFLFYSFCSLIADPSL